MVELFTQLSHGIFRQNIVIEKQIGTLSTQIKQPAESQNGTADVGRQGGQKPVTESVMGIMCGHEKYLLVDLELFYIIPI